MIAATLSKTVEQWF